MIESARKALRLFSDVAGFETYILFFMMTCVAFLEMFSIGLAVPLIHVAFFDRGDVAGSSSLQDTMSELTNGLSIEIIAVLFCLVFIIKNLSIIGVHYYTNTRIFKYWAQGIQNLFSVYMHKDILFHTQTNSSILLRNLTNGIGQSFEAARQVFMIFLESVLCISATIALLLVDPYVTIVMGAALGTSSLAFYLLMSPKFRYWGERAIMIEADGIKWITQSLNNILFAKIEHKEEMLSKKIGQLNLERARFEARTATSLQIPRTYLETIAVICLVVIAGFLLQSGRSTQDLIVTIGVLGMAALRLLPSLNRLLSALSELRRRSAFIDEIYSDLCADPNSEKAPETPRSKLNFQESIELRDLTFFYTDNEDQKALDGVSLNIQRGEVIGIVGPSGAGKTTLIHLILGLLQPKCGSIFIDGVGVSGDAQDWQSLFGYVSQDSYLLDDTFERNIAFNFDDEAICDDRLSDAVDLAHLRHVVEKLPAGLKTVIGEHGSRLSGGQRQRISIARTLYQNPEIIVFDEATSALDNEAENEVSRAIRGLTGKKTIFIIAHRLSTIRHCDRIVYMEGGKIVDTGDFEALYENCDPFRELVRLSDLEVD